MDYTRETMGIDPDRRLIDMSAGELIKLIMDTMEEAERKQYKSGRVTERYVYGLLGIAKLFNCSTNTARKIKESGVIDSAMSTAGRQTVVDAERALRLVSEYNIANGRKAIPLEH